MIQGKAKLKAYYCLSNGNHVKAVWAPSKAEAGRILGVSPAVLAVGGPDVEHVAAPYSPPETTEEEA